jgi:hypothetical protein
VEILIAINILSSELFLYSEHFVDDCRFIPARTFSFPTMKMNLFLDLVLAFHVQELELIFLGKGGSVHTQHEMVLTFGLGRKTFFHC